MKVSDDATRFITQTAKVTSITVDVPIRTVTAANVREHFMARKRRVKAERDAMTIALMGKRVPALPVVVTFTRYSAGTCDDDGLPTAAKGMRDQIAAMYGVGDSPRDPIAWRYAQERAKRGEFGMMVTIEAARLIDITVCGQSGVPLPSKTPGIMWGPGVTIEPAAAAGKANHE